MLSFEDIWPWSEFEKLDVFSTFGLKGEVNKFVY